MNTSLKLVVDNTEDEVILPRNNPTDPRDNWLSKLQTTTVFLSRKRVDPGFVVTMLEVIHQGGDYTRIGQQDMGPEFWVDTARFSQTNELCKVLYEPNKQEDDTS